MLLTLCRDGHHVFESDIDTGDYRDHFLDNVFHSRKAVLYKLCLPFHSKHFSHRKVCFTIMLYDNEKGKLALSGQCSRFFL